MSQKEKYINNITHPIKYSLGMLRYLPSLFFWGIKVKQLSEKESLVTLKHSWTNQNPFGSVYFSALNGGGELATGVLVQLHIQGEKQYSMLVVKSQANFLKKAKGKLRFICDQGNLVKESIDALTSENNSCNFDLNSRAIDENNIEVANFIFTWSIKLKS